MTGCLDKAILEEELSVANHKSALKRIRQTKRRYERSKAGRSRLRTALKAYESAVDAKSKDDVKKLLNPTISLLDRSVQKGVLHRNKANRIKSSLSASANRLSAVS